MSDRFKAMFNAQQNIVLVTKDGKALVEANQAFLDFFGCRNIKDFLIKSSCVCEYFIEEAGYLKTHMGTLSWIEYIFKNQEKNHLVKMKKDGKVAVFKIFAQKITDNYFGKDEILVTFVDITQELKQEELIEENRSLKQALLDNGAVAIFLASSQREIIEVNKRACKMFGYEKEELIGQTFEMIHSSKSSFRNFANEYKKLADSNITNIEYEFKTKDSETIWCEVFGAPLDKDDLTKGIIWSLIDITEKKKAQNELELERKLFSSGPVVVIEWEPSQYWPINYISQNAKFVLGFSREEMMSEGFKFLDLIHKDDVSRIVKEVKNYITNGANIYEQSYRLRLKSGEYRWFYDFTQLIRDKKNDVIAIRGYMFDQTQLKETKQLLYNEKKRLENIIEGTNVGTWEYNIQTAELEINERWATMLGYSINELTPVTIDTWNRLTHPEDLTQSSKKLVECFEKKSDFYEARCRMKHKDGRWVWVLSRAKVIEWDEENKALRMAGTHTYIDEEEKLKQEVLQNKEMLQELFDNMKSGVAIYEAHNDGEDFIFKDINKASQKMDGIVKEDAIGRRVTELFPMVKEMGLFDIFKRVYETGISEYHPVSFYEDEKLSVYRENFVYRISTKEVVAIYDDETQSVLDKMELQKSDETLRRLSSEIPGMVFIFQYFKDGRLFFPFVSSNITTIFELSAQEVSEDGNRIFQRIHPEDLKMLNKSIVHSFETLEYWSLDYRVILPKLGLRWNRGSANPVKQDDGSVIWFGYLYDSTDEKNIEKKLLESTHKAEQANKSKSQFLANMSHEIRTPMNAIIGLSEIMQDTLLDAKQQDLLGKISGSSKMLLGIINDILDYSKIEAGRMKLEFEAFELENIFMRLRVMFSDSFEKKGLGLHFISKADTPRVIVSDELRISQALTNFLSNAYKFTQKGNIKVSIELKQKIDKTKALLSFSVEDEGIGMNEEQLAKLFKAFVQADDSTTRKYGGTGLGLVISKKIVEAMGSSVEVDSKEGVGSRFSFVVEVEVREWRDEARKKDSKEVVFEDILKKHEKILKLPDLSGLKILLVEDNEVNQEVATMMLERVGVEVFVAVNGKEALDEYKEHQGEYDLILMDMQMPIMGGAEATKLIREFDKKIPIVALTAASTIEDRQKALDADMNEHLSKPIDSKKLYSVIEKLSKEKVFNDFTLILDRDFLQNTIGSKKLSQRLYIKFKEQLDCEFRDIVVKLKMNDLDAKMAIHSLRGVSGSLGAKALSEICKKIEESFHLGVKSSDIKSFESIMSKTKKELDALTKGDIEIDECSIKNAIESKEELLKLIELLSSSSIVDEKFFNNIYLYLKDKVAEDRVKELKDSVEDLEYNKAINIVNSLIKEIQTL